MGEFFFLFNQKKKNNCFQIAPVRCATLKNDAWVSQLEECMSSKHKVVGSSPTLGAFFKQFQPIRGPPKNVDLFYF